MRQSFDSKRTAQQCSAVSRIWEYETPGDGRWPYSVHFEFSNATSSACEEPVDVVIYFSEKCNQETAPFESFESTVRCKACDLLRAFWPKPWDLWSVGCCAAMDCNLKPLDLSLFDLPQDQSNLEWWQLKLHSLASTCFLPSFNVTFRFPLLHITLSFQRISKDTFTEKDSETSQHFVHNCQVLQRSLGGQEWQTLICFRFFLPQGHRCEINWA